MNKNLKFINFYNTTVDKETNKKLSPLNIHSIQGECEKVLVFMFNLSGNTHMVYLSRKDNFTYVDSFDVKKEFGKVIKTITEDDMWYFYEAIKDKLYQNKGHVSYYNLQKNLSFLNLFFNEVDKNELKNFICDLFPFMNKFEIESTEYGLMFNNPFLVEIVDNLYFPYKKYLSFPSLEANFNDSNHKSNMIDKLLSITNPLKMVKEFLPIANKETVKRLYSFFNLKNDTLDESFQEYRSHVYEFDFNLFKIFKNNDNLIQFIEELESPIMNGNIKYELSLDSSNYGFNEFIKNDLIHLFSSQQKLEKCLIQHVRNKKIILTNAITNYIEFIKNNLDDYEINYYDYNGMSLKYDILDLYEVYSNLQMLLDKYKKEPVKRQKEIQLIESTLCYPYNDLVAAHNQLTDIYEIVADEQYYFESVYLDVVESEDLVIEEILDNKTLRLVGNKMNHCVATYLELIKNKESSIFVVRDKHTSEYLACMDLKHENSSIVQAKAKYNTMITNKKVLSLIKEFVIKNPIIVDTKDLPTLKMCS